MRLGNNFPDSNKPIKFSDVIYNENNIYDIKTGYFTCVVPGVYEFSFYSSIKDKSASVDLMHNGDRILHSYTTWHNGYITASGTVYVKLKEGDKISLLASEGHNGLTRDSIFSGHLLYSE